MSTTLQNFYKATITRNWSASTGDFNVSVAPTPTSGWLVISPNNSTLKEIIKYTAVGTNAYGPYITVSERGIGGTTAQVHSIGEPIRMNITAEHWAEMQADIDSIIAAGLPAGTTGQTLINTSGTWGAGDRLNDDELLVETVSVSSAELKAINSSPKVLIAAPGSGKAISLDEIVFSFTYGTVQYTSGNTLFPVWTGNTTNILGNEGNSEIANAVVTAASSSISRRAFSSASASTPILSNTGISLYSSANFTTGDGTFKLFIKYRIITL